MSTARTASVSETNVVLDVVLERLRVAPWNARKTFDQAAIGELVASVRQHGIQVPLIVREHGTGLEIIAGHRRYEAAQIADLDTVPCIVRELNDDQAREIGLVDNLQREDVPALEEAQAFGELLQRLGSIPAVAARVGKEVGYVAKRLKLRTLTLSAQDSLREQLITIDHAMLLARLAEDEQNAALKWCLDTQAGSKKPVEDVIAERIERRRESVDDEDEDEDAGRRPVWRHTWEPQSVQKLKDHIETESGIPLDRAPWDLDDETLLQDASACNVCEKNTKANAPLFGDLDMGVAVCTDGACFKEKTQAFVQIQLGGAAKEYAAKLGRKSAGDVQILRVSWKQTSVVPRQLKDGGGVNPKQTFKDGQWEEATKKCQNARPAVTVDWSDANNRGYMGREDKLRKPGEIVQACIEPKCKIHPKAAKRESGQRNENSAEARADREKREAEAKAENAIRAAAIKQAIAKVDKLSGELLRRVVLCALPGWLGPEDKEMFPGLEKGLKTFKVDSAEFARAAACLLFVSNEGEQIWANDWEPPVEQSRKAFIATVKALGYDASKAWDKPAEPKPAKAAKKAPAKKAAKKGGRK